MVGWRVRRVIDEGEREKEGEEEWKCITEIYYGLWALVEHATAFGPQRRGAVEVRRDCAREAVTQTSSYERHSIMIARMCMLVHSIW